MFHAVFDLEGPLSPQDNAYEVMRLIEDGDHIFEVISKYDDVLTLQGRKDYEPGDTLKLIVPFLILNGISEDDIRSVSRRAKIISGATELIHLLTSDNWKVHIISTSYEQHAHNIAEKVGVARNNVYSTKLPLDAYLVALKNEDMSIIEKAQSDILSFYFTYGADTTKTKIDALVNKLDKVFFNDIPKTKLSKVFNQIKVMGGGRKVTAMIKAIGGLNNVRETMAIGDSITDYKMLKAVKEGCGLSIAFNGNAFSLPYASIAVASEDIRAIYPLAKLFTKGGRELTFTATKLWENILTENEIDITKISQDISANEIAQFLINNKYSLNIPHINLIQSISDEKLRYVVEIHKSFRSMVRGAAVANLG